MSRSNTLAVRPSWAGAAPTAVLPERSAGLFTRWLLYAWMFSLPFEMVALRWLPWEYQEYLSLSRIVGVLLMLCFLVDPKPHPWRLPPAAWAFAAFFGVFTLSMLRADFTNITVVFQQLQLLVMFLISYNLFQNEQAARGALSAYAIACGVASLMTLTGLAGEELPEWITQGREWVFGADPNLYGKRLMIGVVAAIGVAHIRRNKGVYRWPVLWMAAALSLLVIAKTGSRGTTLSLFAGLVTFMLGKGSVWLRLRNVVLLALAMGAAVWIFGRSEVLVSRWTETLEKGAEGTSGRNVIIREAWQMVTEKPVFGWGLMGARELAVRRHLLMAGAATHNMVLEILVVAGFAGFLPYLWGYLRVAWASWQARGGRESTLPLALFVALFVADMITGGLPEKLEWTFFAYILAAGTTTLAATRSRVPNGNNGSKPGRARAVR